MNRSDAIRNLIQAEDVAILRERVQMDGDKYTLNPFDQNKNQVLRFGFWDLKDSILKRFEYPQQKNRPAFILSYTLS